MILDFLFLLTSQFLMSFAFHKCQLLPYYLIEALMAHVSDDSLHHQKA